MTSQNDIEFLRDKKVVFLHVEHIFRSYVEIVGDGSLKMQNCWFLTV